jgi:hypothetical protein
VVAVDDHENLQVMTVQMLAPSERVQRRPVREEKKLAALVRRF